MTYENGDHEPIEGRYVHLEFDGDRYRTFYEVAGDGDVPLVLLHTAGADSRQYRHLLDDPDLRERFTMYAFDLPYHGRSLPPTTSDWWTEEYELTTEFYAGFIMHFVGTLELVDPVVLGCSMGGEIILELAYAHAEEVRAVVGLETTEYVPTDETGYLDDLQDKLRHPEINQEVLRPEWTYALCAPDSPEVHKRENWWIYSQAGDGAYAGDIEFYAYEWDARGYVEDIDTDECGVYLLTGEYDSSGRPEDTKRVAEQIDGASMEIMDGIGHFPPAEDPETFKPYLMDVVEEVLS